MKTFSVSEVFSCMFVCLFPRRHSRSMRSSSPDHHHHHSASRHREPPPPRGSSYWSSHSGGWSGGSGDHHYDYDYGTTSSSHHYSRRSRHSARLAKPEIYMEDARKLKHSGDRMVIFMNCVYFKIYLNYHRIQM